MRFIPSRFITISRLIRYLRDDLILDALAENEVFDKACLAVARFLLKVGEVKSELDASQSNAISVSLYI